MTAELSIADLEHLIFICGLARDYYGPLYGLPLEEYWRGQAERYGELFTGLLEAQ